MTWSLTRLLRWLGKNRTPKGHFQRSALGAPYEAHHKRYTPHTQPQLRTQGFTTTPQPLRPSAMTPMPQTPPQIYSMQNPQNSSHPIYYLKILCYKRKKNTMQYKRLTASSSLLHNFQPIRKTNKSPTTGGRGLGLFEGWVFFPFAIRK